MAALAGCGRGKNSLNEVAYVSAPQAFLRDQVAAVFNKTGTVKNGEVVQILARDRRFARVRTAAGAEGWLEQRYLVTKQTYDASQKLADQVRNDPVQATALAHNQSNIHLQPDRDAEHLYQVDQGAKLSLLKRASSQKPVPGGQARSDAAGKEAQAAPPMEDWWLIRDEPGHAGWVLGRMLDVDIPLEIAQYAEGQRTWLHLSSTKSATATRKFRNTWFCSPKTRTACLSTSIRFVSSPGTSSGIVMKPPTASGISTAYCR